jgi:hypothetical protein
MNDILFWLWGPVLLIAAATIAYLAPKFDRKPPQDHRHTPAE